jgi:hypothetical protein
MQAWQRVLRELGVSNGLPQPEQAGRR